MAQLSCTPRHPRTGLYALGVTSRGPVWPVMGGDESEDAAAQAAAAAEANAAAAEAAAAAKAASERGFPADTPVAEMTDSQQAAYWKHQSRQHEGRVKALGVNAEQLQELRDKAARADALEYDLSSDKEKAVADAKKAAEADTANRYKPALVAAKLETAAARKGVPDEAVQAALAFVDAGKFLTDSGEVDTDKVNAFIDGISPGKGNEGQGQREQRRGPGAGGQGRREQQRTGASVQSGRELYQSKYGKTA